MPEPLSQRQIRTLLKRVERLTRENVSLREQGRALRKEIQSCRKELRGTVGVLNDVPGALLIIQQGTIVFVNDRVRKHLGFSDEDLLGREVGELVHSDSLERLRKFQRRIGAGKPVQKPVGLNVKDKQGRSLRCEIWVNKTRYRGGSAYLLNVVGLEDEMQHEIQSLRSYKTDALIRMAEGLTREFAGWVDGADGYPNTAGEARGLSVGGDGGHGSALRDAAHALISDLHAFSRRRYDRAGFTTCDLRKIVKDAVAHTRPLWQDAAARGRADIHLKTYLRNLSPIEGRAEELRDVCVCMILNAVEAMPGGGEIYITTEEHSGFAHVYIQDNGTGIPRAVQETMFDPFFTTKDGTRSGLGLSLAQAAVSRHGGDIEVVSHKGQGSTFIIKLPVARKAPPKARRAGNRIKDSHILIISDETMVKDLFSQSLVSKGGAVTSVTGSAGGVKALKKNSFDLVVVGPALAPGEDKTLIRRIKTLRPSLPVALLDGSGRRCSPGALRAVGADLIIGRPFEMNTVLSLVSEAIANHGTSS